METIVKRKHLLFRYFILPIIGWDHTLSAHCRMYKVYIFIFITISVSKETEFFLIKIRIFYSFVGPVSSTPSSSQRRR